MADVAFRPLEQDDLPRLFDWLSRPHIRKWYAPQPSSFAELLARYGPRLEPDSAVKAYIVEADRLAAGYIQTYSIDAFPDYERAVGCEKGVVGLDLFIADEWRTRHGLGSRVIRRFVEDIVFGQYGAIACVAGPVEGNQGSVRAFEKAGFRRWKTIENERGERECVMRLDRDTEGFRLETIELLDADTCAAFHRDMYLASFGTEEGLADEMGPENERYLAELRDKIARWPEANVHLWHAERIVGQLEMRRIDHEPHVGYVSLLYVLPEFRGKGLGRLLHEHAAEVSRREEKRAMRLSVSLTNPAIMFYRRLGWEPVGTRDNVQPMAIMEFPLA